MARKPKYPWDSIAAEYIAGDDAVTLRALAQKYGFTLGMVGRMASKNGWTGKRAKYRERIQNKTLKKVSDQAATWQARQLDVARKLREKALLALEALDMELLDPQEVRLWLVAACKIESDIMATESDNLKDNHDLDHDQRIERIVELLRSRGVAGA